MNFRQWCWSWWARTRNDWAIFTMLVNLTGVVLIQPIMWACVSVAFCFRVPMYLVNIIDVAGGFDTKLAIAADWCAFKGRLAAVRDSIRELLKVATW